MTAEDDYFRNRPIWTGLPVGNQKGFQESWTFKFNDPDGHHAFWVKFNVLLSKNGFRRVAETWAVHYHRLENREIRKTALKLSHDIRAFSSIEEYGTGVIKIENCELGPTFSRGSIQTHGKSINWDLIFSPAQKAEFRMLPESLTRTKFYKTRLNTVAGDLRFDGTIEIDGTSFKIQNAPGMQAHLSTPASADSWASGHCNTFVNEQKKSVPFVFEGISVRARMPGRIRAPRINSFYFLYQGKAYEFNTLWDAIRTRSSYSLVDWKFQADRGELSFRGQAKAEHRDFVGMTCEDTDGSLLYCAASKLSDLTIWIYRRDKIEATLHSPGTAAFEVVSRRKNPYVPLIL